MPPDDWPWIARLYADVVLRVHLGEELLAQELGVLVRHRVVQHGADALAVDRAWRHEHMNHHRNLLVVNQVVGDFMKPVQAGTEPALLLQVARDVPLSVLPDHERRWHRGVVLRGHVNPVVALHAAVQLAGVDELLGDAALRHARPRVRERAVGGHVVRPAEALSVDEVVEPVRRADSQLSGVEPQVRSRNPAHRSDRLIVHDKRRLRRGFDGPDEIGSVRIERLAALNRGFAEALHERLAKLGGVGFRLRHGEELIHGRPLHRMCASWKQRHAGDDSDDQDAVAQHPRSSRKKAGF